MPRKWVLWNRLWWASLAEAALMSVSELASTCMSEMVASYSQWMNWFLCIYIICHSMPTKNFHIDTITGISFFILSNSIVVEFLMWISFGHSANEKARNTMELGKASFETKNSIREVHCDGTDGCQWQELIEIDKITVVDARATCGPSYLEKTNIGNGDKHSENV